MSLYQDLAINNPLDTTDLVLVGFSTSTRDKAKEHKDNPNTVFWGMNSLWQFVPDLPWSAWFELHRYGHLEGIHKQVWPKVRAHYKELDIPLFMIEADSDFPTSYTFPLDDLKKTFPNRVYYESTVAYILAFILMLTGSRGTLASAIFPNLKRVHLYGIDMIHDTEWGYQRPNAEYWCGRLEGEGIEVLQPPESALMKAQWLYGYEEEPHKTAEMGNLLSQIAHRQKELQNVAMMHAQKVDKELLAKATHDGAAQELENIKSILVQWARGRTLR